MGGTIVAMWDDMEIGVPFTICHKIYVQSMNQGSVNHFGLSIRLGER